MSTVAMPEQLKRELNHRVRPNFRAMRRCKRLTMFSDHPRFFWTEPSHIDDNEGEPIIVTMVGRNEPTTIIIELQFIIYEEDGKYWFNDVVEASIRLYDEKEIRFRVIRVNEFLSRVSFSS